MRQYYQSLRPNQPIREFTKEFPFSSNLELVVDPWLLQYRVSFQCTGKHRKDKGQVKAPAGLGILKTELKFRKLIIDKLIYRIIDWHILTFQKTCLSILWCLQPVVQGEGTG